MPLNASNVSNRSKDDVIIEDGYTASSSLSSSSLSLLRAGDSKSCSSCSIEAATPWKQDTSSSSTSDDFIIPIRNGRSNSRQFIKTPSFSSLSTIIDSSLPSTPKSLPSSPSSLQNHQEGTEPPLTDTLLVKSMSECKNDMERGMLNMLADKKNLQRLVGILFIFATLQSVQQMTLYENLLNIAFFLVQCLNNYLRQTNNDTALTYEESFKHLDKREIIRTVFSMVMYTLRMMYLPKHKMIFLPVLFIWFAGANKLYIYSTFWGLLPTYYASVMYISLACYFGFYELLENGYTETFLNLMMDYFILVAVVWMWTYYLVNVTGFLKHKVDKLKETRKRLESALEARSRFIAHVSHEFRCPIMSSIGCLELLKETPLNEKQNDLVDTIVSSNSVILLLIEDILQIVKIEHESKGAKKEDTNIQPFNIFESLKSLKGIISGYASNFKVKLNLEIDEGIKNLTVLSNPSKIHQILSNLLTNAVKASKKDDDVWLKCNILEKKDDETVKIRFTCQDFGCGIPPNLLESIFEPFVQLQNNSQSKVPSSGLGLTTVSHLIKTLNGTINVESQVGIGSSFTVDLAFKIVPNEVKYKVQENVVVEEKRSKLHLNVHKNYLNLMSHLEEGEKEMEETPKFNSNVLIAEDNPINRKVIVKMINSMGSETDFVCDGKELVEKFNPSTHKVVFTDMVGSSNFVF
ncbi:predicted protein [Naegleria gruberi]|uniref:histidine kinase n=1 Tax=Naegleria gruberi TaxID=5762 RepID=D2W2X6_NAEGR|nr:uncharacterized protein NAEGRDRAFT_75747 [Naegleria gruberi]EFC36593.1 predicted protein [Naegleria gruberi]|eukprot:XP_002669337.1 predicted protein [Naegleria gruberi strain NEG-M]